MLIDRLPRGVLESPSLSVFITCLDIVQGKQLWVSLLEQGGETDDSRGPFQSQPFCDFVNYCPYFPAEYIDQFISSKKITC